MSLSTLNKGDKVIVKGFTGIKLGVFEVAKVKEKSIVVNKKDGTEMIFSKKTGKQTNVEEGKEKYANSIMIDDGSYVPPTRKKSKKNEEKPSKKSKKTPKAEPIEETPAEEDEDFEDEDEFDDED